MGRPVRTGGEPTRDSKGRAAMELFIPLFLLFLALSSVFGLTADSRDGTGWHPADQGREWRSPPC
jgi:hypothetical protein